MQRIQAVVARLLREAASRELAGPWESRDTTAAELSLLKHALGPYLEKADLELAGRADIDALIRSLRQSGL